MCASMRTNPYTPEFCISHQFTFDNFESKFVTELLEKMDESCYVILSSNVKDFSEASKEEIYGTKFLREPLENQTLTQDLSVDWPCENDYVPEKLPIVGITTEAFFENSELALQGQSLKYKLPMVDIQADFISKAYKTSTESVVFYELLAYCLDQVLQDESHYLKVAMATWSLKWLD
jgi:secreted Zn-dependent insulinase-like peptidase